MTIVDPCDAGLVELKPSPFYSATYMLGSKQIIEQPFLHYDLIRFKESQKDRSNGAVRRRL